MKTYKVQHSHMDSNKDVEGVIFDILVDKYGQKTVCELDIDLDNAYMSNGFVNAINNGLTPMLPGMVSESMEYHHVICGTECITLYFE